jgi:hypothetical protein
MLPYSGEEGERWEALVRGPSPLCLHGYGSEALGAGFKPAPTIALALRYGGDCGTTGVMLADGRADRSVRAT